MSDSHRTDEIQGDIIHVYDGIEEADNSLPLWWLATFYAGIVFAVFYWIGYQELPVGTSPLEAYGTEMTRRAASGGELTNDVLAAVAENPDEVAAGRALFAQHCVACHGANAEGQIGPNLTDGSWIHGGNGTEIFATIRDGVPAKSMPNWGPSLGNASVRRLTAFVLSVRGTNVPGKEPQGEPFAPAGSAPSSN